MRKALLAGVAVAALALTMWAAGSASAAPGKAPIFSTLDLVCDGETITIVTQDHGMWSPGWIEGTNGSVLVPYSFSGTFTDTVTGETFSFNDTKPGTRAGESMSCTAHVEEVDPSTGHLLAGDFTALVIMRGH